uniref:Mitochondrial Rho GTPase n=1 Tax=Brassica campestris TaxID=3711 RepID=M4F6B9_BRACM
MARYSAGTVVDFSKSVRIVVIGDKGTGKSSLIAAAATNSFPPNVPPVLPDTKLPLQFFPDGIAVTIVDTSSRPEDRGMVAEELKHADAVVLTHASDDRPETLQRLSTYWLPELRRLEVKVPIIVAGCKLDLDKNQVSFEQVMSPIMNQFREIETCIECSALKQIQVKCFNAPLQPNEIEGIKRVVQERLPEGVNEIGLTVAGFLFLHALFIEKGRIETTWTVLRKFGYNNDVRLANEWLPPSLFKRAPDQSVELTDVAIEFLKEKYMLFDADGDNNLRPQEIEDLFSTAPESPWKEAPYEDAAEKTALGGLSSDSFLSLWSLMTVLEPARSVEHLICIGFQGDPSSAIRITRRRLLDRKKKRCERKVVQCFVFGPNSARKSALLNCFLGRSYADNPGSTTTDERYAVNMVDETGSAKKTLVMREIPEDGAQGLFSSMESLAKCDIAVFVYDSSDESSWKRASELLVEVANHGEATGYEVPCLMVSAKDDIVSSQIPIQDSTRVTQDVGIEHHVSISSKLEDFNNLFRKIITAAQHPHLSIPETEAGKSRKHYNRKINRFLMVVSIVAAVVVVGLAAYFVYVSQERVLLPEKIENEGPNFMQQYKRRGTEIIRESQRRRLASVDFVDEIIKLDKEWRQRQFEVDALRTEFNKLNKQVAKLKISGGDASELIQQAEKNKQDALKKEKEVGDAYAKLKEDLVKVGNLVPDSCVVVFSYFQADNPVIKIWGEKPVFAPGKKVMNHVDLVENTFIADTKRGAEIAGGRGYFLRGHGVLLNHKLLSTWG